MTTMGSSAILIGNNRFAPEARTGKRIWMTLDETGVHLGRQLPVGHSGMIRLRLILARLFIGISGSRGQTDRHLLSPDRSQ